MWLLVSETCKKNKFKVLKTWYQFLTHCDWWWKYFSSFRDNHQMSSWIWLSIQLEPAVACKKSARVEMRKTFSVNLSFDDTVRSSELWSEKPIRPVILLQVEMDRGIVRYAQQNEANRWQWRWVQWESKYEWWEIEAREIVKFWIFVWEIQI